MERNTKKRNSLVKAPLPKLVTHATRQALYAGFRIGETRIIELEYKAGGRLSPSMGRSLNGDESIPRWDARPPEKRLAALAAAWLIIVRIGTENERNLAMSRLPELLKILTEEGVREVLLETHHYSHQDILEIVLQANEKRAQ